MVGWHHQLNELGLGGLRELVMDREAWRAKETISKVKRQPSEWEKIITNKATERINLKNTEATPAAQFQKSKRHNQKMGQRTEQIFLQRRHKMANKHMKRCSTSLIIREMSRNRRTFPVSHL